MKEIPDHEGNYEEAIKLLFASLNNISWETLVEKF